MFKQLVMVGAVLSISACSSYNSQTPVMAQFKPQYCYQTTTINTQNGNTVNSQGKTECSDNPNNKHFLAYSGMAKDCREHWYDIVIGGTPVKQRGYECQKLDGSWEVLHNPY